MSARYTNVVERGVLIGAFALFALIMLRPLVTEGPVSEKVVPGLFVLAFVMVAARAYNRPSIELEDDCVVVRGPLRTRVFDLREVCRWNVETARVGAFRRSVLVAHLDGGRTANLGREGIWASIGGARERELRDFVARLDGST